MSTLELLRVAFEGNVTEVARLLATGVPVDAEEQGQTALLIAAGCGHEDVVQQLLEAGASPRHTDQSGMSPLLAACRGDEADAAARLLLLAAPDMAAVAGEGGTTPLFVAVAKCSAALAAELLQAAPHTATQPGPGMSPLEAAMVSRREDMACMLLRAAPAAARQLSAQHHWMPIHQAAAKGLAALVALLLQLAPETAMAPEANGALALHLAAVRGHTDVVRLLLDTAPAAAAVADSKGHSAFFYAAQAEDPASAAAIVRLLLVVAPEAAAARNHQGLTALHLSCVLGDAEVAHLLVQAAPAAAMQRDVDLRYIPLQGALERAEELLRGGGCQHATERSERAASCAQAACATLAAVPAHISLPILRRYRGSLGRRILPLFTELAMHWPLDEAQWQHLPLHGGLSRALPVVLARSEAEARLLVAHLPPPDRQRLQVFALCLHRLQNRL